MPSRDDKGDLAVTTWTAEDQFGWERRGTAGTTVSLEMVDRDAHGFATVYRHVRLRLKGKDGDIEFLFNSPEAKQFAEELLVYARECGRVKAAS